MRILITGVAGLIGSRLADWIINNIPDAEILGIDNLSGGYKTNIPEQVMFHDIDLAEQQQAVEIAFRSFKPDYVFHLAAYAAEGLSPFIRAYNYTNNLVATANIVTNCIKFDVKRLVFTSSMAVYGNGIPPFSEIDVPNPIDPYGVAKYACEMDIQIAGEQHGLDWCIIRPHNVYGKNQNIWDRYRNVLGIWMYQHLSGEAMTIFGDGKQQRAFSYIDDILPSLWKAAITPQASKEIVNLGGSVFYTINEANELLRDIIEDSTRVIYKEARHEVKNAHPTWAKSVQLLGYEEKVDLRTGLQEMWNWAKQQPKRKQFSWPSYELDKGIYSIWK